MSVNPNWFLQSTKKCDSQIRQVPRGTNVTDNEQVKKKMDEMTRKRKELWQKYIKNLV